MKYRAMLAYYFERPVKEVRCILAAHKIASEVNARCAAFEIKTIEVAGPVGPSTISSIPLGGSAAVTR
jgi:hypothetical protein